jgi:hypothetical protein
MSEEKYGFQGVWIPASVWNHSALSWREKCLVAEIDALSSAEHGPCHASCEYLAHRFDVTAHAMREALSQLIKRDIIWQLGFDGRRTWRCVNIALSCNQDKYKAWASEVSGLPDSSCQAHLTAKLRCQAHLTAGVSSARQQVSGPPDTEIPVEVPEEKRIDLKINPICIFPPDGEGEVTEKESKVGGQLQLDSIDAALENRILSSERPRGMPPLFAIKSEVFKHGLPESDAEYLYDSWLMSGFKLKSGKMIQDWKAAIRTWNRNEWFPSQRQAAKAKPVDDKARVRAAVERMQANDRNRTR